MTFYAGAPVAHDTVLRNASPPEGSVGAAAPRVVCSVELD